MLLPLLLSWLGRRPVRALLMLGLLAAAVLATSVPARAEMLVVGIDRKFAYDEAGRRQALAPGRDELMVFDLADPAAPALVGSLPLENSIVGPPTNIAVTPDGRLALVANSLHSVPGPDGAGFRAVPADEVFVIDLAARPLRVLATLKVGLQPSGMAINRAGTMALVANREGRSLTVLSITGAEVKVADTVPMNDVVASVAFTPDGRRALAVKFAAHKVALVEIGPDGRVTYPGRDLTVGPWPYQVAITPDGRTALVGSTGSQATSDGNADVVSVVDLAANPPRTVDHVTVGDSPEGLVVAPGGEVALATVLSGTYDAPVGAWYRRDRGRVVSLAIRDGKVAVADGIDVGSFPEGIAVSADGRFAYAGNFASHTISVLRIGPDGRLLETGRDVALPGPPASLRIGSQ